MNTSVSHPVSCPCLHGQASSEKKNTASVSAQEAHEAIRPSIVNDRFVPPRDTGITDKKKASRSQGGTYSILRRHRMLISLTTIRSEGTTSCPALESITQMLFCT